MSDDNELEPTEGDYVVGWDGNTATWTVSRVDVTGYSDHPTYRDAMRRILEDYQGELCWHEQDGGGLITDSPIDPHEELRTGWEGEDY